jgi:hypothetical protein
MDAISIIEMLYSEYKFHKIKDSLMLQGVDIDILEGRISRLGLLQRLEKAPQFRKEEHVIKIINEMNQRTEFGRGREANISINELVDLFKDIKEPIKTIRMCIHEIEKHGLIYKDNWMDDIITIPELDFTSISNKECFCFITDGYCRGYDLANEAIKAIKFATDQKDRTILCQKVMEVFNWNVRKMNSVLKFMESLKLIEELEPCAGDNLWDYYFCLTNEADFFEEKYDIFYIEDQSCPK